MKELENMFSFISHRFPPPTPIGAVSLNMPVSYTESVGSHFSPLVLMRLCFREPDQASTSRNETVKLLCRYNGFVLLQVTAVLGGLSVIQCL